MKDNKQRRTKPRNRERKCRIINPPKIQECRHMWMDGVCLKCGCLQQNTPLSTEKQPR